MMPTSDATQGLLDGILGQGDFGTPAAELTPAAQRVLESRYFLRNAKGEVAENARQLFSRVARAVAQVEGKWVRAGGVNSREAVIDQTARGFFELLSSLRFLPNSPTLMNAGRPKGQLSACFVLPIEDDLGRIFESLRDSAIIHKTGGGTGFNFGKIRPAGDRISSSGGVASGPLAFLRIFDSTTQTVKQGGTRRGANMAIMPVDHPDIESFITSKTQGGIENFNISVGVSDLFMKAVKDGATWSLRNPHDGKITRQLRARSLWRKIALSAWSSGDPGVVFLDKINNANPTPAIGPMESTNPCGEQPLLPYESCNLGSMNLLAYVQDNGLNWGELERDITLAVRFLDNIIEANSYPLLAIEEITLMNRKIGLGVMGWADVLMEWGVAYDSDEAVGLAEQIMQRINEIAIRTSEVLAIERGAFAGFAKSIWAARGHKPRRNATVTTVAPTGTISLIAGVSSGIEPVFSLAFEREALEGDRMIFVHPALKRALRDTGVRSRKILMKIIETGSVAEGSDLPLRQRRVLRTATEIKPIWHVRMQAAFQKHTENGVSKTINLPGFATAADVQRIYESAFCLGCKGITVFRDASKSKQVLRRGLSRGKGRRRDLLEAVDWLLDDDRDHTLARKKASVGMASLSREQLKRQKR
ncbi:MAG: adenosylcobalamin-dependent ribonucleoside-diphosphate reductase [Deltaproteobacteria bacterium]|nr:adenosylcobalamin-dependent ribonucleoside-diphosphate reductase [Deltaproteobacteria bacterium]